MAGLTCSCGGIPLTQGLEGKAKSPASAAKTSRRLHLKTPEWGLTALKGTMKSRVAATSGASIAGGAHKKTERGGVMMAVADSSESEETKDTRIHWKSDDEGWIGDVWSQPEPIRRGTRPAPSTSTASPVTRRELMPLLTAAEESYYKYMGLRPDAPVEEVKAAFRRLSKEYHPDTTSLPVVVAAEKFMRLREAYTVLSDNNMREGYDLKLAQEVVDSGVLGYRDSFLHSPDSSIGGRSSSLRPREALDKVDKLDGENMELSNQAQTGLIFDLFALGIAIVAILYTVYVKGK